MNISRKKLIKNIAWYSLIIIILVLGQYLFYWLYLMSKGVHIDPYFDFFLNALKIFWIISLPYILFNLLGLILYGPPKKPKPDLEDDYTTRITLRISYCTKGDNYLSILRSLQSVKKALNTKIEFLNKKQEVKKMFKNVEVEVITDSRLSKKTFPAGLKVNQTVVPKNYKTKNKSLYKSRAIHYSLQKKRKRKKTWVLRLDEESHINVDTLLGLAEFLQKKDKNQVIAQGEILYNSHQYGNKLLITVADSIRTGDDLGRFRLQYKLKRPLFGMHGSFVFVRSDIEKTIGFDDGPTASITEDAHFALKIEDMGYEFGWLNGCIYEQSPYSVKAFIMQRKRWFIGIGLIVQDKNISLKSRITLSIALFLWLISWLSFVATLTNIFFPTETNIFIALVGGFVFSTYVIIYVIGTQRNLKNLNFSLITRFSMLFMTVILIPFATLLEALGVLCGLFNPPKGFEIVEKN